MKRIVPDIFTPLLDDTDPDDISYDTPRDDPESECYQCDAGMCSVCKGEMYDYDKDLEGWYYDFD